MLHPSNQVYIISQIHKYINKYICMRVKPAAFTITGNNSPKTSIQS